MRPLVRRPAFIPKDSRGAEHIGLLRGRDFLSRLERVGSPFGVTEDPSKVQPVIVGGRATSRAEADNGHACAHLSVFQHAELFSGGG